MPDGDERKKRGHCPICSFSLKYEGAGNQVQPFWERINEFFAYPFQRDPLMVLLLGTFVPLLLPGSWLGLIGSVMLLAVLTQYAYSIIEQTSEGRLNPPAFASAFSGGLGIMFQQMGVFILFALMLAGAFHVGGSMLGGLALAFILLVLPASTMVLALEKNVADAVNPLRLLTLVVAIGWPYMRLYGYLVLLSLAMGAAQEFALLHFPTWIGWPLSGFLSSYFLLVLFNMLGYLMFQYQGRLGYAADIHTEESLGAGPRDRSKRLDADIDMNLKDGHYEQVLVLLEDIVRKHPENNTRVEHLYRLLKASRNIEKLEKYGERFIRLVVDRNQGAELCALLRLLQVGESNFRVSNAKLVLGMLELLYHQGEYRLMFALAQDAHKRFPEDAVIAEVYFFVARALANGLQQWDKALTYLKFIERTFPDHPIQQFMPEYQAMVAKHERLELIRNE